MTSRDEVIKRWAYALTVLLVPGSLAVLIVVWFAKLLGPRIASRIAAKRLARRKARSATIDFQSHEAHRSGVGHA